MILFDKWWCCLNPRERNALTALLPYFAFAGSYVRQDVFYTYWLALGFAPDNAMVVWFISIYALIAGTVDDGSGGTIDVFFFDLVWWSQMYTFSLTDGFICAMPCRILTYSNF